MLGQESNFGVNHIGALLRETRKKFPQNLVMLKPNPDSNVLRFKYKNFNLGALTRLQEEAELILLRLQATHETEQTQRVANG
jgi:hypothetical protein